MNTYEPFNPDFCGYPEEQDNWEEFTTQGAHDEFDRANREQQIEEAFNEMEGAA